MTTGRTRHLAAVAITVLLSVTVLPIAPPAAVHATSTRVGAVAALANATVGGLEILQGRAISNRVFTNVDAEEQEVAATYDAYIVEAQRRLDAAVAANDPTLIERSQRVLAILEQERSTKAEILQGMRQNAYDAFRRPEFRRIIAAVANAGPVRRIFDGARTELVDLSSKLGNVRAGLQGGSGISIVQLQTYTAQIERWRTVWSMVSGPSGRNLTALADRATAGLRRATLGLGQVDAELAETQAGLQALSQAVQDLKTVRVRPRGGGFFGFVTNLLGIDTSLLQRLRALIRPRVSNIPGYSAADIDKVLGNAVVELMRRRISDCGTQPGYSVRTVVEGGGVAAELERVVPARGEIATRMPVCGGPTDAQLLGMGNEMMTPVADTGPADSVSGGGLYALSSTTPTEPGAIATVDRVARSDLSVRDTSTTPLFSLGASLAGMPRIDVTYDLANGTVSGRLEAEYECTADACMGAAATGAVQAEFGPIAFTQAPTGPPPDWPFPAHHWYELSSGSWYAMQAVDVAVQLSGTGFDGRAGSYDTTVRGWVQVELSPLGGYGDARPQGWQARVSLRFDYPDTVPQQWYVWLGMDGSIWDPRIAPPTDM